MGTAMSARRVATGWKIRVNTQTSPFQSPQLKKKTPVCFAGGVHFSGAFFPLPSEFQIRGEILHCFDLK